jgi:small multidrug resistance pump
MEWIFLIFAFLTEVAGTTAMKLSQGFTRIAPSIAMGAFYTISFGLLTLALKKINLSSAFAIWSGASTALIAVIGFAWFKEPLNATKIISLVLIILGVMGLELSSQTH